MRIRKLDPARVRDVRQFVQFPFKLYRDCPQWVPPFQGEARRMFDRERHPFYRHSVADFFVAESGATTLGRIAVMHNRRYTGHTGRKAAFFYFFDAVEDLVVSRALFAAAFDWARERGLDTILGPKGMLRADGMGLLVEGFEHRATLGIPYNYAYYPRLVEDAGFEKEVDYLSGFLQRGDDLPERFYRLAEQIREHRGFTIKSFRNREEMRQEIAKIGKIYNEAFTEVWGYYPVDDEELALIADRLISAADPRLIKLVMKGDEVAGFVLAFPDVSAAFQHTKGRLWPFGWLHLMREFRRTEWLSLNGMGFLPRYQGVGANAVLYVELAKTILARSFKYADIAQVAETNLKSMGDMTAIGVHWYKRHRIYRRALG